MVNGSEVKEALQMVLGIVDTARKNVLNHYTTQSLPDIVKLTKVEPLTIVSKDLLSVDYLPDVNSTLLNMFTAYYLQAVNILGKVKNAEVIRTLDALNPDRDLSSAIMVSEAERERSNEGINNRTLRNMVLENYRHSLPMKHVSLENDESKTILQDVSNMAVGKLINVEFTYQGENNELKTTKLPINVRLLTSVIPTSSIIRNLTHQTEDISMVERFHTWRSGRIGGIRDLIFCQDLIDEYKKAMIEDDTGTTQEIVRRATNSKKYGLLTNNPSMISASTLYVLSADVAREVEQKLGGRLSNASIRNKAFENTYAMIICVVDREDERVTFYTRGVSASMSMSIKEIRKSSQSKGPDLTDLMRAMQQGIPAF